MRIGIIDLGTNSVRFDVHQLGRGPHIQRLHREKLMLRLGEDIFLTGRLSREAKHRALHAFKSFRRTAADLHVRHIAAFATSALRTVSDSEPFLRALRRRTGIEVRVISGKEEARLIAQAILRHERRLPGRYALVDIGGGSTEVSLCEKRRVLASASLDLGTARLQQVFLKSSPPRRAPGGEDPVKQLRRHIRGFLAARRALGRGAGRVIGSSGTIRTLADIKQKLEGGGKSVPLKFLKDFVRDIREMTIPQLLRIPGMEAKRVDMILAGAVLLEEIMEFLGAAEAVPTGYSLRDGILDEEIRAFRHGRTSPLAFHLDDLTRKAERLGCSPEHIRQVSSLAEVLFNRLRPIHKLPPRWKTYLAAAVILHDTGERISPAHHERHSHYIATHADFPLMEPWEAEFIGQLCLWHTGGKVDKREVPFWSNGRMRRAFLVLLSILRVADALDRGHRAMARLKRVEMGKRRVRLTIAGRGRPVHLEMLRVEQKKDLFEKVFGRTLETRGAKISRRA